MFVDWGSEGICVRLGKVINATELFGGWLLHCTGGLHGLKNRMDVGKALTCRQDHVFIAEPGKEGGGTGAKTFAYSAKAQRVYI